MHFATRSGGRRYRGLYRWPRAGDGPPDEYLGEFEDGLSRMHARAHARAAVDLLTPTFLPPKIFSSATLQGSGFTAEFRRRIMRFEPLIQKFSASEHFGGKGLVGSRRKREEVAKGEGRR